MNTHTDHPRVASFPVRRGVPILAVVLLSTLVGCAGTGTERDDAPEPVLVSDAEGAVEALTSSPRHGEWIDIPLADGTDLRSWIVYPERSDGAPVVIVIHEIMGLTDWIRAVADGLAAEGCIAIAPDLLSGKGPNGGGTESFSGDTVRRAIRGLEPAEVLSRLDAALIHGRNLPAAGTTAACIGFCWGGRTTFVYATHQPALDGAIVYYGTGPAPETIDPIAGPVLGFYGGDDARVTSTVADTLVAMRDAGKDFRPYVFEGAGHGFLRQQTAREGANAAAAREAWTATIEYLRTLEE